MNARSPGFLAWLSVAAVAGLGIMGVVAWQTVRIERAEPDDALRRLEAVRSLFADAEPVLSVDAARVVTRRPPPDVVPAPPTRFRVLAYRASSRRLVRIDLPFWFVRMKGAAAQYWMRGTGLDFERLGLNPADLEAYGVCLVLDESRENGDRILVWTE